MKTEIKVGIPVVVQYGRSFYPAQVSKLTATQTVATYDSCTRRFEALSKASHDNKISEIGRNSYGILWLDVDAAKAEQQRLADRVIAEQQAKAKAKADARAKEDALVAQQVMVATQMAELSTPAGATPAAQTEQRILRSIGADWIDIHESLLERSRGLAMNPAYYFEWAEHDMKNAAKREILDSIIRIYKSPNGTLLRAVKTVRDEIQNRILNNYDRPSSSSVAHNAMMVCKLEARCSFLGTLNYWVEELSATTTPAVDANPFCAPMA